MKMFKSAHVYRFTDLKQFSHETDFELPMVKMEGSELIDASGASLPHAIAIRMRTKKRSIPASVVKKKLDERVLEYLIRTGKHPTKRDRQLIKDELLADLALRAFVIESDIWAYFDLDLGYLIIDTPSGKMAERMAGLITSAGIASLRAIVPMSANEVLTKLAVGELESPFEITGSASMEHPEGAKAAVQKADGCAMGALEENRYAVVRLGLRNDLIACSVDQEFVFRSIKLSDVARIDAADENEAVLCVLELGKLINDVAAMLYIAD